MMKIFSILTFIFGFYLCYFCSEHYNFPINKLQNDTIAVHDTIFKDSLVHSEILPSTVVISVDSVNIDTISTIVNGQVMDKKLKILFK